MVEIEPDATDKQGANQQKEPSHFSHKIRRLQFQISQFGAVVDQPSTTLRPSVKTLNPPMVVPTEKMGRAMCQAIRAIFITNFRFRVTGPWGFPT